MTHPPPHPGGDTGPLRPPWDGVDLGQLRRVLAERAPWACGFLLAVILVVGSVTALMERAYTAETVLLIEREPANVLEMNDAFATALRGEEFDKTAFDVLLSRNLAERVIRVERLAESGLFGRAPPGAREVDPRWITRYLEDGLEVEPYPESKLVAVRFTSPDPELSARVANAHARAFIEHGMELRSRASEQAVGFLRGTLGELRQRVEASQLALDRVRRETGVLSLNESQSLAVERLTRLNDLLVDAEAERIGLEAQLRLIEEGREESLPAVMQSEVVARLKQQLVKLEGEYAYQVAGLEPAHPQPVSLRAQRDGVRDRLRQEIRSIAGSVKASYQAALQSENELRARLDAQQAEALRSQAAAVRHAFFAREEEANQRLYESVRQRIKEMSVLEELPGSNVFVIDEAYPPLSPSRPRVALNLGIAVAFGAIGGVLLALFADHFDSTLRTPADLERHVALASLGCVPDFRRIPGGGPRAGRRLELVPRPGSHPARRRGGRPASGAPSIAASEAYRAIRTGIVLSRPDAPPRTLLFTSSVRGEGKTTTAINTALMFAQLGEPVLLIDADLRRPRCHRILGFSRDFGLSEILTGHAEMVAEPVAGAMLDLVPSGASPPNPTELLGSQRMRELIAEAASRYPYVFIDAPPLLPVSDAVVLATLVDGVVFVVDAASSPRQVVVEARARLEAARATTLGVVLNRVEGRTSPYVRYARDYAVAPQARATG